MARLSIIFFVLLFAQVAPGQDSLRSQSPRNPITSETQDEKKDQESFGDYVKKAGLGIWNRLKERFNLDEAAENIKERGANMLKRKEDSPPKDKEKVEPKTKGQEDNKDGENKSSG